LHAPPPVKRARPARSTWWGLSIRTPGNSQRSRSRRTHTSQSGPRSARIPSAPRSTRRSSRTPPHHWASPGRWIPVTDRGGRPERAREPAPGCGERAPRRPSRLVSAVPKRSGRKRSGAGGKPRPSGSRSGDRSSSHHGQHTCILLPEQRPYVPADSRMECGLCGAIGVLRSMVIATHRPRGHCPEVHGTPHRLHGRLGALSATTRDGGNASSAAQRTFSTE